MYRFPKTTNPFFFLPIAIYFTKLKSLPIKKLPQAFIIFPQIITQWYLSMIIDLGHHIVLTSHFIDCSLSILTIIFNTIQMTSKRHTINENLQNNNG
jgi:hypothetical protein